MNSTLPSAVPEIPVSNLSASIIYYRDRFGFSVDWVEEGIGLAGVSRDACRLFLANMEYRNLYGSVVPVVIWLNLDSREEVDGLYRDWSSREANIKSPPESKSWGLHEFTALDDDENRFRVFYDFATPEREVR